MSTLLRGNVRVREEDGNKIFIENFRYIGVTIFVHSFTLIYFAVENLPRMLETLDFVLKKDQKRFGVVITVGTDFVHIFKSTFTQYSFDGRARLLIYFLGGYLVN